MHITLLKRFLVKSIPNRNYSQRAGLAQIRYNGDSEKIQKLCIIHKKAKMAANYQNNIFIENA